MRTSLSTIGRIFFSIVTSIASLDASAITAPGNVVVSNVGAQTVGSNTFYSSTQLAASWSAPSEVLDHYVITGTESIQNTSVSATVGANITAVTLNGLKAATTYTITVQACADSACATSATSSAGSGTTSAEYWQLSGTGNTYATLTRANTDGNSLSWVMRWGSQAGAEYAGRFQYYYKTSAGFSTGRTGIGIANTVGTGVDVATLTSFSPVTGAGLRNPCASPDNATGCATSGVYFVDAIQAVPMTNGKVRVFFEALDALDSSKPVRIYSLDNYDGYVGQDFHSGSNQAYCSGTGSADYASGGACALTTVIGNATDTVANAPLKKARQFKIGFDWVNDWRWDEANGTFMVITGEDTCGLTTNGLFYAVWDGSKWSVKTDANGCATALVPKAHGPVLVPVGGAAYKLYYEDESNGTQSGKPFSLIYGDGKKTGASSTLEIGDWENSSAARQVHFLWPDNTVLDAQDEAGLGDHMVLVGDNLYNQYMFLNLGGFDNSKWKAGSSGLGVAKLLNPFEAYALSVSVAGAGAVTSNPSGISCGSDCNETVASGSTITLTATPDSGKMLIAWGGACSGNGVCTVTMDAAKTVTATFGMATSPVCTLTSLPASISAGGTSTLTANCSPAADSYVWTGGTCAGTTGVTCTVTPTTTTTYSVAGVNTGGNGTAASATVTVTPVSTYALSVENSGTGYGAVASSPSGIACYVPQPGVAYLVAPDCSENYTSGTSVTLTATPDTGSSFTGWSGACSGTGACTVSMTEARSVTATFALNVTAPVCTLNANPSSITAGSSSTLTATCTPAATSYIWTGGTCAGTSASTCTVSPTSTTTYTVQGSNAGGTNQAASTTVTVSTTTNTTSYTVPGTLGNDVFVLTAGNSYYGGGGNDTFIISPNTLRGDVTAKIIDTEGDNLVQLVDGMTVTASAFYTDAAQLTLSSGAKVQILGASKFKFQIGANALAGDVATVLTYADFVTSLGASLTSGTLPASGTAGYVVSTGFTQAAAPSPAVAGASYTVPGTLGDDVLVPSGGNNYLGGGGNDTYIISPYTLSGAVTTKIIDTEGSNVIQLVGGLTIESSTFFNNAVQLTLSLGAKVQILGASGFSYQLGANAPAGETASSLTFAQFASTLGASVPTGTSTVSGSANFVVHGGGH